MDGQPIGLLSAAGADHLKALARIARLLRDQDVAKKLRASRDAQRSIRCWRCRRQALRRDRHSGMVRRTRPQMCNCASGNLEIPGSRSARRNDDLIHAN
jgi:hypothetical protein